MSSAFESLVQKLIARAFAASDCLPDTLPEHPWELFRAYWNRAHGLADGGGPVQPNPNAMSLATVDPDGSPSCRVVLCRGWEPDPGYLVFYTNYTGRKGRALLGVTASGERGWGSACCNFHWDTMDVQARFEGVAIKSPSDESDEYFAQRGLENRIGAWASDQSEPIGSRGELLMKIAEVIYRYDVDPTVLLAKHGDPSRAASEIPRPPHWGGFRLYPKRVELWCGSTSRVHDRAEWTRDVSVAAGKGVSCGAWRSTRIQP